MIDSASIREIIEVYKKHGWSLRRVLLSPQLRSFIGADVDELFGDAGLQNSDLDAAWFSRTTKNDGTAWEIRHLSAAPFALLVVVIDEQAELEKALLDTESRLRDAVSKKITGH